MACPQEAGGLLAPFANRSGTEYLRHLRYLRSLKLSLEIWKL